MKWSILQFKEYLRKKDIDVGKMFDNINDVVIKTVISFEPYLMSKVYNTYQTRNNFYELFGFDVLIDKKMKPWLIEVNVCPSLNCTTRLDSRIKTSMICDIQNLLGYIPYDKKYFDLKQEQWKIEKRPSRKIGTKLDIADLK